MKTISLRHLLPLAALLFGSASAYRADAVAPQAPAPQAGTPQPPAPQIAAPIAKPPAAPATPAAIPTAAKPGLWVVRDADTTIYLFGTIHVLKPGMTWFGSAVKAAFDRSDELRLEMVLPDAASAQAAALKFGTLPAGQTLTAKLPTAAQAKLAAALAQYRLPAATFDRYTPWFTANNLTVLPLMTLGYKLEAGAEQVLSGAAKGGGKTISGFETLDQQFGYFASLSEAAQVSYLTGVIDELPKVGTTVDAMVLTWAQGDPAALARVLNDDLEKNGELAEVLLYRRNANWADWIAGRLKQPGSVFVAVGAGHLAGAQSVQALLAKRGVSVTRVDY